MSARCAQRKGDEEMVGKEGGQCRCVCAVNVERMEREQERETHQLYVVPRSIPMTVPTSSGSLAKPVAASARSAVRSTAADTRIVQFKTTKDKKRESVCVGFERWVEWLTD